MSEKPNNMNVYSSKKLNSGLSIVCSILFVISFLTFKPLYAQNVTDTPTPTVTESPAPSVSPTSTPTPTPTPTTATFPVHTALLVEAQYPWDKKIPVRVELTPRVDAQGLDIRWPSKTGFKITPQKYSWNDVKKGTTYVATFIFEPIAIGNQTASADIVLTTFENKFVSSVPLELTLDSKYIVQPISEGYKQYELMLYGSIGFVLFVILPVSLFLLVLYIKNKLIPQWIQKQLNEPI